MVLAHHPHVVAGAAGHDVDAAHILEKILAEGKILKDDLPLPDAGGKAPAQGLRLLHDLLEHEVLVPALLGGINFPIYGDDLFFDRLHQVVVTLNALPGEDGQLPVLHVAHPARVTQDGSDITGNEIAPLPVTQNQRAVLSDGDDLVGTVGAQDAQGVGSLDAVEHPAHGLEQVAVVEVLDELGHHLGVGLRGEGDPLVHEEGLQLGVILDDPVVDHSNLSAAAHLRVGVDVAGGPVGGPAGVSHPRSAVQVRAPVELVGEHLEPPLGLSDGQRPRLPVEHRHPGGVVPPVFQPGQSLQQNGGGLFPSDIAYNSAHI